MIITVDMHRVSRHTARLLRATFWATAMSNPSAHRTRRSYHRVIAVILMTMYLIIVMKPLAPFAMHSKVVAHAVTGECVGDCDICGCSAESRANRTCCCAKKKLMQAGVATRPKDECCPTKTESTKKSCCATSQPVEPVVTKNDCCAKDKQHLHDENAQNVQHNEDQSTTKTTVFKCGCPCGTGKLLALTGIGSNELIPIIINEIAEIPHVTTLFADLTHRLASRHGEPPDPPPRRSQIS